MMSKPGFHLGGSVLVRAVAVCVWLFAASGWGQTASVVFALAPPPANQLAVSVIVTVGSDVRSDIKPATFSGNPEADLTLQFGPVDVSGLEFTGGALALSDVSFELSYGLLGKLIANSRDVTGSLDTPVPPGPVVQGAFPTSHHVLTLNGGSLEAFGTGLIGLLLDPVFVDLSVEPVTGTFNATGSVALAQNSVVGNLADYTAVLSFPILFNDTALDTNGIVANLTIEGTVDASGPAAVVLPPPAVTTIGSRAGEFTVTVEPGATYVVDLTDDFLVWTPAWTGTAAATEITYTDPSAPLPDNRAYRVRF